MAELMSDDAVDRAVAGLGWERDGDALVKIVTRRDFAGAMDFVNAVAALAEEANHHPDIAIAWNRVTLRLSTHSAGGITSADVDLAGRIDGLG